MARPRPHGRVAPSAAVLRAAGPRRGRAVALGARHVSPRNLRAGPAARRGQAADPRQPTLRQGRRRLAGPGHPPHRRLPATLAGREHGCVQPVRCAPAARRASYLPFGAGPTKCIGEEFGLAEATLILASIAARWNVLPAARTVTPAARGPVTDPDVERGVEVTVVENSAAEGGTDLDVPGDC